MEELSASERSALRKELQAADLLAINHKLLEEVSQIQLKMVEVLRENFKLRSEVEELRRSLAEIPKQKVIDEIPPLVLPQPVTVVEPQPLPKPQPILFHQSDGSDFESDYSGDGNRYEDRTSLKAGIPTLSPRGAEQLNKALSDMQAVVKRFETAHVMTLISPPIEVSGSAPEPLVKSPFLSRVMTQGEISSIPKESARSHKPRISKSDTDSLSSARSNKFEKTRSRIEMLTHFLEQPRLRLASGGYDTARPSSQDAPAPQHSHEEMTISERPMFRRSRVWVSDDQVPATEPDVAAPFNTKPKSLTDTLIDLDSDSIASPKLPAPSSTELA